jgi:hypothetical protein
MPIVTDARLRDIEYMSNHPISSFYRGALAGWAKTPHEVLVTVLNRMAWLIKHMEHAPNDNTCCCGRWYLDHLEDHVPLPDGYHRYTTVYIDRLNRAIEAHEARAGYSISTDWFARLVGDDETSIRWVLYGPLARYTLPPSPCRLDEMLDSVICTYCWKSSLNN